MILFVTPGTKGFGFDMILDIYTLFLPIEDRKKEGRGQAQTGTWPGPGPPGPPSPLIDTASSARLFGAFDHGGALENRYAQCPP